MSEVVLGCKAKDVVSGFVGIITSKTECMNGNIRYGLEGEAKDNKRDDGYEFDSHTLDFVDEGISSRVPQLQTSSIDFGAEVEDRVSGFKGIVSRKCWFINGCHYIVVVAKITERENDKGKPVEMLFDHSLLDVVTPKAMEVPPKTRTGGPVTKALQR